MLAFCLLKITIVVTLMDSLDGESCAAKGFVKHNTVATDDTTLTLGAYLTEADIVDCY